MKPGKYYVGDLCYVLHEVWDEFCNTIDFSDMANQFVLSDGREVAFSSTMYGDGEYSDQHGRIYSVDAGLIGVILADEIVENSDNYLDGGNIIEFTEEFNVDYVNGDIIIGNVIIQTGDIYDEYEEDSYYDEDEENDDIPSFPVYVHGSHSTK